MNSTSRPASITSPVISCPRIRPCGAVVRPLTMCWSLPQIFVDTIFRITPWAHFRVPRASLGKSMLCTSTFPGPMYAKPRLLAIVSAPPLKNLIEEPREITRLDLATPLRVERPSESRGAGLGNGMILIARPAAHPDGANHFAILLQRYPTGKNHNAP